MLVLSINVILFIAIIITKMAARDHLVRVKFYVNHEIIKLCIIKEKLVSKSHMESSMLQISFIILVYSIRILTLL